ncbi:MAG TPA: transcription termination factor NusA, partial [Thermoanaerobaculia bacterium]
MAGSTEMLAAFRELTTAKQLERSDLLELLRDGIQAALVRKYGPNVKFELNVDELQGTIRVVRLRQVVEAVEDTSWQISLEEAQYEDPDFQVGDMLEEEVPFGEFGRLAVQAAKQRIIQRVREGERARIREEFTSKVGDLLSGEVQQIERGKLVIMLNKFREAEAIIPYREQNHREHFHQGDTIRAVLKRLEETPKGPRLILARGDPLFVKALFKLEVPEIQQQIVEIRAIAREVGSRTKVAVISRDDAIDPVGACVGLKGSRVQAAKQRIIQRVREGERMRIRDEFASKVGELLSGEVQQIERGKLVVMLNKFREAEAIIPYREQNHREHFHQGDTIRAVLKRLEETPKGPRLILSRADPLFVKALFKLEVPEIQQQVVEIRAIAREVGSRTKVAVISRDD